MYIEVVWGLSNHGGQMRLAILVVSGAAACGYPGLPELGGPEITLDGSVDGSAAFLPSHLLPQTLIASAPDLGLSATPTIIDTSALTINGVTSSYFVQQSEYAVLFANIFSVTQPVTIQGTSPLIVVAYDHVIISASIDLGAKGPTSGPGALTSGPGGGGPGATFATPRRASGGGGGSYGTLGGSGGPPGDTATPAGSSGVIYGRQPDAPLVGGAPGGAGGYFIGSGTFLGKGGGGGGALQISSRVSIDIGATAINAGGGGGGRARGTGCGGGGGGAGGEIFIEAPLIMISGTLAANGGGGGPGASGNTSDDGTDGLDGSPGASPAPGGNAGQPNGAPGGAGAAGTAGSFVEAQLGSSGASDWGGGGGGAGRIWLRYRAATPPDLRQAVISPPASLEPMLP